MTNDVIKQGVIDALHKELATLITQREKARTGLNQWIGAVFGAEKMIASLMGDKKDASKDGEQQEGDSGQHQDGNSSGEAQEPSNCNSIEQSHENQQEG